MLRQDKAIQVPYLISGGILYAMFVVAAIFTVVML